MPDRMTEDRVRQVARLARIQLSDGEVAEFTGQIESVLEYVGKLNELDTEGVEPMAHALPVCNVLRDDEPRPSLPPEQAVREAPDRDGTFFRVPKVLGDESGA